jgi:hypothetical protein
MKHGDDRAFRSVGNIGVRRARHELGDLQRAVPFARIEHIELAVRGVLRMKRETKQPALTEVEERK